ncbi:hypothetical protein BGZ58_005444 [Dissophora ornata]|nr:hypothetical protein BGZ58_005444 [Dissophora ornata]
MDKAPLARSNLIPFSLLSTSVFERSKKATLPPVAVAQPSTLVDSTPTPKASSANASTSEATIKREPAEVSAYLSESMDTDHFVQGQSRRGRQQYEGPSHRQHVERDRFDRPEYSTESAQRDVQQPFGNFASKRRIRSPSPEPRKRPAGVNGEERRPRRTSGATVMEISPDSSPLTGSINALSPQSQSNSGGSEQEQAAPINRGQYRQYSQSNHSVVSFPGTSRSVGTSRSSQKTGKYSSTPSAIKSKKSKKRRAIKDSSEDSSSTSSDSDSNSSSSDDTDQERHQLTGVSTLKLHGIIHDLMLELERTRTKHAKYCERVKASSKRIRDISKKLERRFRDLSESATAAPSAQERAPIPMRSNSDKSGSATSSSSIAPQPSTPNRKGLNYSSQPQPVQQQSAQSWQGQQAQSPVNNRMASASSSSSSLPNTRLAPQNDRFTIAASDVVETFTNIHTDVRNKAFGRKPKNMVTPSSIAGVDMEEIMVTSSLEGSIDFWDLNERRVVTTVPKNRLNQPWPEDMCWVGQNVLAVAGAHKEGVPMNHQLMLIHVEKTKMQRAGFGQSKASSLAWSMQALEQMPHDKGGIMCMASMGEDASGIALATAAMDKQIINWRFTPQNSDGECVPIQQQVIHSKHTSTIQGLCYDRMGRVLYSGGCDCKIVGWDMERSEAVLEYKSKDGRINSILQNPVDPSLFLVCQALTSNQLSLHDNRQRFERAVLRFGSECADRLSKQIMPSWHPNGAIVSSGMHSESKINLWDIRWRDVQRGAGQSIDVHGKGNWCLD